MLQNFFVLKSGIQSELRPASLLRGVSKHADSGNFVSGKCSNIQDCQIDLLVLILGLTVILEWAGVSVFLGGRCFGHGHPFWGFRPPRRFHLRKSSLGVTGPTEKKPLKKPSKSVWETRTSQLTRRKTLQVVPASCNTWWYLRTWVH